MQIGDRSTAKDLAGEIPGLKDVVRVSCYVPVSFSHLKSFHQDDPMSGLVAVDSSAGANTKRTL
jgi:hypothetical protein